MKNKITPHEPGEPLLASADEAIAEGETSQKRWEQWEKQNQLRSVCIQLPENEYITLEKLAIQQGKTTSQVIQNLVHGVMATLQINR